ncbi:MAG: LPXTG cell wall anchor domain-containing protein [Clostridia bacterium]|nr:LPXTG cell wall anchor domain-containing protein [Clostridia bacterium]
MGKPAANSGFGVFRDPGTAQRKLTLLDSSRSGFAASAGSSTVAPGGTLAVTYSGAKTGTNEYVSAMITDRCCDGGTIINYKLPRTGDDANLTLWFGCVLGGLTALALTVSAGKRKKANSK